ncbi:MAG: nuclear transport factor 2 family protein [Actinobacteria bacterium]|nr:nuclear transport factor 2 family protein [Actinomycetota bacterium]
MADLEQMLVELEREGGEALVAGRGGEYYREHLAADALMAFPFGVMSRDDAIAAMESAQPWSTFEIKEPRVVALTEDCGVVVYLAAARRAGDEPYSAVISSTFVRRGGAWKLAFHHQAPA